MIGKIQKNNSLYFGSITQRSLGLEKIMATITKKQLVEKIAMQTQQTKLITKKTVQLLFDTIIKELEKNNRIELRDFGVFEIKKRAARIGRNPKTGATVKVPTRNVVSFKVGRKMKQNVASGKR
jgi:integration host factor subunit beta